MLSYLPSRQGLSSKYLSSPVARQQQGCMGWGQCVKCYVNDKMLIHSTVSSSWELLPGSCISGWGKQLERPSAISACCFQRQTVKRPHFMFRAWLPKDGAVGGIPAGSTNRSCTCVKPRLCVKSPYPQTWQLDWVSALLLPWLCHCRVSGQPYTEPVSFFLTHWEGA